MTRRRWSLYSILVGVPNAAMAGDGFPSGDSNDGECYPDALAMLPRKATVVEVRTPNQEWLVKCQGSFWRARTRQQSLSLGDQVKVVTCHGNVLLVEKVLPSSRQVSLPWP